MWRIRLLETGELLTKSFASEDEAITYLEETGQNGCVSDDPAFAQEEQ